MVRITGQRNNLFHGTITAGGTLSSEIDVGDFTVTGIQTDANLINSTLSFQVAPFSDNDIPADLDADLTPLYRDVLDSSGSSVTVGPVSGAIAVRADTMLQYLLGYRYVKVKTEVAQTNGMAIYITAR